MHPYSRPRKPYVPIDTCSPGGTWIEEKRYNRTRPTGHSSRKVLCGNWQDEQVLEDDMLAAEEEMQRQMEASGDQELGTQHGTLTSTLNGTASLDVIKNKGNGHYTGGFMSTPYLTCDASHPNQRHLETTHRADFNATSSDVRRLWRPDLGARSQLLLQQARQDARAAQEEQATLRQTMAANTTIRSQSAVGGAADLAAGDQNASVYKSTICNRDEVLPVVSELRNDYLSDEPITLYTGNPRSGKKMVVHGKTPAAAMGHSQFGKHTYFSDPKYGL